MLRRVSLAAALLLGVLCLGAAPALDALPNLAGAARIPVSSLPHASVQLVLNPSAPDVYDLHPYNDDFSTTTRNVLSPLLAQTHVIHEQDNLDWASVMMFPPAPDTQYKMEFPILNIPTRSHLLVKMYGDGRTSPPTLEWYIRVPDQEISWPSGPTTASQTIYFSIEAAGSISPAFEYSVRFLGLGGAHNPAAAALRRFREAQAVYRKMGNRFGVALTLMNVGIVEQDLGRYGQAKRHYRRALALADQIHFAQIQTMSAANIGDLCLVQEKYTDRRIARKIGDRERLLSLDLVEIEGLIAVAGRRGKRPALRRVGNRLDRAEKEIQDGGFLAEAPRLLRLRAHAQLLSGGRQDAEETIREEKRLSDLSRRLAEGRK